MGGRDLRYQKRERAILRALVKIVKNEDYALTIRPSRVYQEARVARSTFRRHYREVGEIFAKKDRDVLGEFRNIIKDKDLKSAWRKTLIFIAKNREIFELKFVQTDDRLLRRMVEYMEEKMDFGWERYEMRVRLRIFEMFYAEVVGILNIWAKDGMKVDRIEMVAKELVYLTRVADKKWGSVVSNL